MNISCLSVMNIVKVPYICVRSFSMSKQSGPNKQNSEPKLSSPPVMINRVRTGFFDLPVDPSDDYLATQSRSAPSNHSGMMEHAKPANANNKNDDEGSEELGPQWFTLPPLEHASSAPKVTLSAKTQMLLNIIDGFILALKDLQKINVNLSASPERASTASTNSTADDKTLTKRYSFNKKGSKAEIIQTMITKIQVLLVQREQAPLQYDDETLANSVHKIFETAQADLKKRFEFNKETTNIIKARVQNFMDDLKPFKSPSSAPTSSRNSYR